MTVNVYLILIFINHLILMMIFLCIRTSTISLSYFFPNILVLHIILHLLSNLSWVSCAIYPIYLIYPIQQCIILYHVQREYCHCFLVDIKYPLMIVKIFIIKCKERKKKIAQHNNKSP